MSYFHKICHCYNYIYVVAVMDFNLNIDGVHDGCLHHVKLVELESNKVFHDKLTFVYLEMPKFTKKLEELNDNVDKWLYVLKNISQLQNLPDKLRNRIFEKLFKIAEIAKYSHEEWIAYQLSLKDYRDNRASILTAIDEGRKEGRKEGIKEGRKEGEIRTVYEFIKQGFVTIEQAARSLNITKEQLLSDFNKYNLML